MKYPGLIIIHGDFKISTFTSLIIIYTAGEWSQLKILLILIMYSNMQNFHNNHHGTIRRSDLSFSEYIELQ